MFSYGDGKLHIKKEGSDKLHIPLTEQWCKTYNYFMAHDLMFCKTSVIEAFCAYIAWNACIIRKNMPTDMEAASSELLKILQWNITISYQADLVKAVSVQCNSILTYAHT